MVVLTDTYSCQHSPRALCSVLMADLSCQLAVCPWSLKHRPQLPAYLQVRGPRAPSLHPCIAPLVLLPQADISGAGSARAVRDGQALPGAYGAQVDQPSGRGRRADRFRNAAHRRPGTTHVLCRAAP